MDKVVKLPIKLDKRALQTIKDISIYNYGFKKSLFVAVIEALDEYIKRRGGEPGFILEVEDME